MQPLKKKTQFALQLVTKIAFPE